MLQGREIWRVINWIKCTERVIIVVQNYYYNKNIARYRKDKDENIYFYSGKKTRQDKNKTWTFCPVVFTTTGAASPECAKFFQRLCGMLTHLDRMQHSQTVWFARCRLSFALLHAASMCLHGSRSSYHWPVNALRELAVVEGQGWATLPYTVFCCILMIKNDIVLLLCL